MDQLSLPKDIAEFADYVQTDSSIPHLQYEIYNIPALAAQYNTMIVLSTELMECSTDSIKTVIAHEISHRSCAPGTHFEQNLHMNIAEIEGISKTRIREFLNIIYDLVVDKYNLHKEWCDTYIIGLQEQRPWEFDNSRIDESVIFNNINVAIQKEYHHADYQLTDIDQQVFDLLYTDGRSFEKRLIELARLFEEWMNSQQDQSGGNDQNQSSDSGETEQENDSDNDDSRSTCRPGDIGKELPFSESISKEDADGIAKKLTELYNDLPEDNELDADVVRRFHKYRAMRIILPIINGTNLQNNELRPAGTWFSDNVVHELDLQRTLQRSGVFIPGLTAQRVAHVPSSVTKSPTQNIHVAILADVSGSMSGEPIERLVEAIIALNHTAKQKCWPVSLIEFNHMVNAKFTRSYDYNANDETALSIQAGGGTNIDQALGTALQFGYKTTTFILTDESNYSLIQPEQYNKLKQLIKHGDIFLYCIGQEFDPELKKRLKPVITKAYSIPETASYSDLIATDLMEL